MKEVNSVSDATNTYGEDIKLTTTGASTLYKTIITELEKGAGEPLYPGDERRIFGEALVPVFVALYNSLNDVGRQTLLRYARGEVLDAIGERQDVKRLEGTPAKTTMRFSVSTPQEKNIIIPKWTKVTPDSENYFATDEIAVLQAGAYAGSAFSARCVNTDGALDWDFAYGGRIGLRPACNLSSDLLISDSVDSDGCYTVIYNQAPTAPSSITVPSEVLGGENLSISWAASTDPDGNLSGYVLERKVGSGTWAQIYKGSSRSYTDAITYGWTSVQYRVKAYDAAGAESAYTTSVTRTVTNNRPPVISGTDGALGSFSTAAPSYEYTVTDADGHQVDVVEMLDGVTLRSYTVTLGHTNTLTIGSEAWLKVVNGSHTLKIVATDAKDASVTRTLTFTKAVTSVEFEQTLAMEADAMPTKALVNIQGNFPAGCTLQVWICNNGNDASPTWEDITQKVRTGQKHYFTNKTKTAAAWGVKVKAKLLRGSATETCYIQSIGGNFA